LQLLSGAVDVQLQNEENSSLVKVTATGSQHSIAALKLELRQLGSSNGLLFAAGL
jgi:hypothetical protein